MAADQVSGSPGEESEIIPLQRDSLLVWHGSNNYTQLAQSAAWTQWQKASTWQCITGVPTNRGRKWLAPPRRKTNAFMQKRPRMRSFRCISRLRDLRLTEMEASHRSRLPPSVPQALDSSVFMRLQPQAWISMADPFSIAASILTVLQVANSVITTIQVLKNAPEEHKKVEAEVRSLQSVLRQIYEISNTAEKYGSERTTLATLKEPLDICRSHLETLMVKLAPMHGFDKARKCVTWSYKRGEIKDILTDVERQKATLVLALQIETQTICDATRRLCLDNRDHLTEVGVQIGNLESRIASGSKLISTTISNLGHQSLSRDLQEKQDSGDMESWEIVQQKPCASAIAGNSTEPHVLPAEMSRVRPKRERRVSYHACSRGEKACATVAHYGSNHAGSNVVYGGSQVFSGATIFFGRA